VLVVDQFEELWTQAPAESAARDAHRERQQYPFIEALLAAANDPGNPVQVAITLRADFLHRAAEHGDLARAIAQHDLIVSPMTPDELRRAIESPAQVAGAAFEPGLVDELIAQTAGRHGALPLLEYTLLELWNARRSDGAITWAAFRALGGVEGALAARADAILAEHYIPAEHDELRHLLVRLVQPGENAVDTRRRALLADPPAGSAVEELQTLLAPLVDARLLQQDRDWRAFPTSAPEAGCRFFTETRHNICGNILASWRAHGLEFDGRTGTSEAESVALFGLPLSDTQSETFSDGQRYVVQWFERARFELHPENGPPYDILLGLLGAELRSVAQLPTPTPIPTTTPTPTATRQPRDRPRPRPTVTPSPQPTSTPKPTATLPPYP
jgi:Novel STAND NTPase 1